LGVQLEFMQKSGSWYSYGGDRIGQGKDNVRKFLKERPEIAAELEQKIRDKAFGGAEPLVAKLTAKSDPLPIDDVL
jgi:recombination protein RecA